MFKINAKNSYTIKKGKKKYAAVFLFEDDAVFF